MPVTLDGLLHERGRHYFCSASARSAASVYVRPVHFENRRNAARVSEVRSVGSEDQ